MSRHEETGNQGTTGGASPYLGVSLGVMTLSTGAILVRQAQMGAPSLVVAAWRLTLASLILAPLTLATRRCELRALSGRDWVSAIASGLFLAVHFGAWITSLAYTSVAASVTLVSTYPIFVALVSGLVLRERVPWVTALAIIIAAVGSVIIGLDDRGHEQHRLLGDALALLGGAAGAGYFLIGRRLRGRLSLLVYVLPTYTTAALALSALALALRLSPLPETPRTWLWLLLMAIGPQIVGHSSLNWALGYLSAIYVTVATLGEPVGSTLLAWWLLDERPGWLTIVGGTLVLAGIAIASGSERRRRRQGRTQSTGSSAGAGATGCSRNER